MLLIVPSRYIHLTSVSFPFLLSLLLHCRPFSSGPGLEAQPFRNSSSTTSSSCEESSMVPKGSQDKVQTSWLSRQGSSWLCFTYFPCFPSDVSKLSYSPLREGPSSIPGLCFVLKCVSSTQNVLHFNLPHTHKPSISNYKSIFTH